MDMELGLSTLLFPNGSPETGIELASKLDLDYVEIILDMPHFPLDPDPERMKKLGERTQSEGLKVRTHGRFWDVNPVSLYPRMRELSLDQTIESIRLCHLLGGDVVTVHPGRCWFRGNKELFEECKGWFQNYLEEISDFAKEREVNVSVETGSHGADYPGKPEELLQAVQDFEDVGITLDIGHAFLSAQDRVENGKEWISHLLDMYERNLTNIHIHDNNGSSDEHLPPGQGSIDFYSVINELKDYYNGPLILELWEPPDPFEAASEGFEYIRNLLG